MWLQRPGRWLILVCLLVLETCEAQTYYVNSASAGDGDGTTQDLSGPHAAWKEMNYAVQLKPGDTILFNRGDQWNRTLWIMASGEPNNYITFGAYGTGAEPLIDVSDSNEYSPAILLWGVDYAQVQDFRLKGNGSAAAFFIRQSSQKSGSGAMGDGFTVTVRDVNILSNYGAGSGNNDGFSLHGAWPDGSSQAIFYNISAAGCWNYGSADGSHQCFTTHESCKAKIYGARFSDCVSWYASAQAGQAEFYDMVANGALRAGIVISGAAAAENYCIVKDSRMTMEVGGPLFKVSGDASQDSPGITIQDSVIQARQSSHALNSGNVTLLRNLIDINDPGWRIDHEAGQLVLKDNEIHCGQFGDWVGVINVVGPANAQIIGNRFIVSQMENPLLLFTGTDIPLQKSVVRNNIFVNFSQASSAIQIDDDTWPPIVRNNVFYNDFPGGCAIDLNHDQAENAELNLHFENNIFYNVSQVIEAYASAYTSSYNCYYNSQTTVGLGSIVCDPKFVDPENGDFHLRSQGWRWDQDKLGWTWDNVTSRAVDAGNPTMSLGDELMQAPDDSNGTWSQNVRINMGAYGGTDKASLAPANWTIWADADNNGTVDWKELSCILENWLLTAEQLPCDLYPDGQINSLDFAAVVGGWQQRAGWLDPLSLRVGTDIDRDGRVNAKDFAILAAYWNDTTCDGNDVWCDRADINNDEVVDGVDLRFLEENWLAGY